MNDQGAIRLLQDLAKAPGGLVLMFTDAKEEDNVRVPRILPRKMYRKIKLKRKNAAIIKNTIRYQITHKLDQFTQHPGVVSGQLRLAYCAMIARMMGINVDEDIQECEEGKQLAVTLVVQIISLDTDPDSTASAEDKMLPLQSCGTLGQNMTRNNIDKSTEAPLAFNSTYLRRKRKRLIFAGNNSSILTPQHQLWNCLCKICCSTKAELENTFFSG